MFEEEAIVVADMISGVDEENEIADPESATGITKVGKEVPI